MLMPTPAPGLQSWALFEIQDVSNHTSGGIFGRPPAVGSRGTAQAACGQQGQAACHLLTVPLGPGWNVKHMHCVARYCQEVSAG